MFEPIVLTCECPGPANARKHVLWEISKGARIREIGTEAAVWAGPGKYEVSSTVLLTLLKKIGDEEVEVLVPGGFRRYRAEFEVVGKKPPDPDDPDPPKPGSCDSVATERGKQVCAATNQVVPAAARSKRKQMAAMYKAAADGLESGTFRTINDSNTYLRKTSREILNTQSLVDDWAKWGVRIGDMLTEVPNNRTELIKFYRDVALGLEG